MRNICEKNKNIMCRKQNRWCNLIWTILDNFRECSQAFQSIIAAVAEMERENIRVQTMGNLLLRRMLFVTDCKYGLTETDVKHILKMKKGKKFGERKENRSE